MSENNLPDDSTDDEKPFSPIHDPTGEFNPNGPLNPNVPARKVRLVDGVSSSKTYAVMAVNGEHRMCIRYMYLKPGPERNRNGTEKENGKTCLNVVFKVHIEKEGRKREEISQRSFTKFGLPDVFWYKSDRFTGLIEIPFAYTPNNLVRLTLGFEEANIAGILWETVLQPALDNGAEVDVDKRHFAKWVYSQVTSNSLDDYASTGNTRGFPVIRAYWDDLSGNETDQSFIGGSFPEQNYGGDPEGKDEDENPEADNY